MSATLLDSAPLLGSALVAAPAAGRASRTRWAGLYLRDDRVRALLRAAR